MSARKLIPIGKRVLIDPLPAADQSAGGILMPEQWKQPSNQGRVVAVGKGVELLQPGDTVFYSWINGREVEHEGRILRLLHVEEILGLITNA